MDFYMMRLFVSQLLLFSICFWGSSTWQNMSVLYSRIVFSNAYSTVYLCCGRHMCASASGYYIILLWALMYQLLHRHMLSLLLGVYQWGVTGNAVLLFEELPASSPKAVHYFQFPPVGSWLTAHVSWGISVPLSGNVWLMVHLGCQGCLWWVCGSSHGSWPPGSRDHRPESGWGITFNTRSWLYSNAGFPTTELWRWLSA